VDAGRAAISKHLLPVGITAANPPPHAAAAVDRWDRQTEGRTDAAYYANSVNNKREQRLTVEEDFQKVYCTYIIQPKTM